MDEPQEGLPVTVEFDAAEMQEGLGALADPTHAAVVEALADHVLHRTLSVPGGQLEILATQPAVVHLIDSVEEVVALAQEKSDKTARKSPHTLPVPVPSSNPS